jgi:hypothetical protein
MLPDLAGLVSALNGAGVQFVVIGGVAVGAHGHIRATEDLDIVPDPDRDNLDRLGNALVALGARLASNPKREIDPEVPSSLHRGHNLTVTTNLGDLDVVQRMAGIPPWHELARDAETTALADQQLTVSSRAHLIAMKRARASLQDQADIEALENDS